MSEFNAREALAKLQEILQHYDEAEDLERYTEETYINDILFFLGKSIDEDMHNWAQGYRKFMATRIYPKALREHEEHRAHFARKLGNGA
jgi:hypothetical protein